MHFGIGDGSDSSPMSYPLALRPKVEDIQRDIDEEESKPVTRHAAREKRARITGKDQGGGHSERN